MIRLRGLSLARGSKQLLKGLNLDLPLKGCVAVIGPNGAGKSSFLALLRGDLLPDAGKLELPLRHAVALEQSLPQSRLEAWRWLHDADTRIADALKAQARASASNDADALALAHEAWLDVGGADAQARVMSLLHGLGFSDAQSRQEVDSLSGGWRMRLNLARALFLPSDLLLLDEPTNHLDLDAVIWLERWLRNYGGLALVASHDRDFLDAIADLTLHIDQASVTQVRGGYSAWEQALAEQSLASERQEAREHARRQKLEAFINRFRAQATRARQVQSRLKVLEAMHRSPRSRSQQSLELPLDAAQDCPDPLLSVEALCAGYGPTALVRARDFALRRGDRIGLLGANGAGKSTLVRTLVGELAPLGGQALAARNARLAYFAQSAVDELGCNDSPLLHLRRLAPDWSEQALRDWLGRFAIRGNDALREIGPMSGGERARLVLAGLFIRRPHALILDEPTNHLDALTRDALAEVLAEFQGALLLVSHDRYLLKATVDSLWMVGEGHLQLFDGDLDDYARWLLASRRPEGERSLGSPPLSRQKLRQQAALQRQAMALEVRPLQTALHACESRLEALRQRIAALDGPPTAAEGSAPVDWGGFARERGSLAKDLLVEEERWLELAEALEECRLRYSGASLDAAQLASGP
ncbi:MAG: ABC-F family ATP-binding cassette domain-containing protein [Betaproteobacteria bacterium]